MVKWSLLLLLFGMVNLVSALGVNIPTNIISGNGSQINVNDSRCWQGFCTVANFGGNTMTAGKGLINAPADATPFEVNGIGYTTKLATTLWGIETSGGGKFLNGLVNISDGGTGNVIASDTVQGTTLTDGTCSITGGALSAGCSYSETDPVYTSWYNFGDFSGNNINAVTLIIGTTTYQSQGITDGTGVFFLQPTGGRVGIGSTSDDGISALQVVGNITNSGSVNTTNVFANGNLQSTDASGHYIRFNKVNGGEGVVSTDENNFNFQPASGYFYVFKPGVQNSIGVYGAGGGANWLKTTHDNTAGTISTGVGDLILAPAVKVNISTNVNMNNKDITNFNQLSGTYATLTYALFFNANGKPRLSGNVNGRFGCNYNSGATDSAFELYDGTTNLVWEANQYGSTNQEGNVSADIGKFRGLNISGNVVIDGNVSFKRPYGMFSSNETQTITNPNTPYIVDFNNIEDNYEVYKQSNANFSFGQTGDYLIELSAIFVTDTNNKHIEIWVQKINGTGAMANVPRSNTRVEIPNAGAEQVVAVPFILDMNMTDKFRIMMASDDAGSQMVYTTNTSYSPETPSIIMTISKISEITLP